MEELEEHLMKLGEQRADAFALRVTADDSDETDIASAAVSAAMGVLSRGGALAGVWDQPSLQPFLAHPVVHL